MSPSRTQYSPWYTTCCEGDALYEGGWPGRLNQLASLIACNQGRYWAAAPGPTARVVGLPERVWKAMHDSKTLTAPRHFSGEIRMRTNVEVALGSSPVSLGGRCHHRQVGGHGMSPASRVPYPALRRDDLRPHWVDQLGGWAGGSLSGAACSGSTSTAGNQELGIRNRDSGIDDHRPGCVLSLAVAVRASVGCPQTWHRSITTPHRSRPFPFFFSLPAG